MKHGNRSVLRLEQLEDRWVPATVREVSGILLISNQNGALTLTQMAANQFKVQDGAASPITFSTVSSINITGTNAANSITVNLNTFAYTGSLLISSGNGNDTVTIFGAGAAAAIQGNTTVLTGLGTDVVNLNFTSAASPVRFGGNVLVDGTASGMKTLNFGNATAADPTTTGGNLSVVGFNTVNLGITGTSVPDVIGGNLSVQDSTLGIPVTVTSGDSFTVNKSVTIYTGSAADTVSIGADTVNGDTSINLGNNSSTTNEDILELGLPGLPTGTAVFNGNVTVSQGSGAGEANFSAALVIGGNLTGNLGDGNNAFDFVSQTGFTPVVAGSVSVTMGNGDNSISLGASVGGNIYITLGNSSGVGSPNAPFGNATDITTPPGGMIFYRGGNGPDILDFSPLATTAGMSWNVNVVFGSNDDTFELDAPGGTLTGYVDGGGSITGNTFIQDPTWILGPNITITNFP